MSRDPAVPYPGTVWVQATLGAAVLLCGLGAGGTARAQDPPAGYQAIIGDAVEEFSDGHWAEARAQFERAHALFPNARTLRGIGMCAFELGDYPAAVRFLDQSLGDTRRALTDAQRDETQALLARARAYVGHFLVRTQPPGGEVRVDGEVASLDADGRITLGIGEHVLTARAPGYRDARRRVQVGGGEDLEVTLPLRAAGLGDPPVVSLALFVAGAAVWLVEPFSIGWWIDREGAVSSCASPPDGLRCDNGAILAEQRDAAIATSVAAAATGLAVAAVGLVIWLAGGGDAGSDEVACGPSLGCRF